MYAVFVITAILLSVAPMHAHTFLAALNQNDTSARQSELTTAVALRHLAPAPRVQPSRIPAPPIAAHTSAPAAAIPATPIRPTLASTIALLENAPNAP